MKKLRHAAEAAITAVLLAFFRFLPPAAASATGGFIGRTLGRMLSGANKRTYKHLRASLPGKTDREYRKIVLGMWDNLGRVFAEYPHLERIAREYTEVVGTEHLGFTPPAILISYHGANWEMAATSLYVRGIPIDLIYRAPNNPSVNVMLKRMRSLNGKIETHPKSAAGMKKVIERLKAGKNLGILIDQKYNQGVEAQFFGQPAMTSPAFIQLATKYKTPVIPVRVERLHGCHFRVTIHPYLDMAQPADAIIRAAHDLLEKWISERPEQWIWLHRRWKKANEPAEPLEPAESLADLG